jgi:hypothetical protein
MPESLPDLESRRAELVKQFARLGDLRSGSISNTSGQARSVEEPAVSQEKKRQRRPARKPSSK